MSNSVYAWDSCYSGLEKQMRSFSGVTTVHRGYRTQWYQLGSGDRPLVLLHGGHGSWAHWIRNIKVLYEAGLPLIIADLPCFGRSDAFDGSQNNPDRLHDLISAVVSGVDQLVGHEGMIDLAGFSFGGLISSAVAANRGNVRRLALLGPAGHETPYRLKPGSLENWRVNDPTVRIEALRQNLVKFMFSDKKNIDTIALVAHQRSCEATRFDSRGIEMSGLLSKFLSQYSGDVLGIWGEDDMSCNPELVMRNIIGNQKNRIGRIQPHAGHWVQYEKANAINAVLIDWFVTPEIKSPLTDHHKIGQAAADIVSTNGALHRL